MTPNPAVTKAVIPAAGLGTRFLPATKSQPKEMLPIVDKPSIQYVVEEAVRAGLRDVLLITGRGKRAIEDHFDRNFELEYLLAEAREQGADIVVTQGATQSNHARQTAARVFIASSSRRRREQHRRAGRKIHPRNRQRKRNLEAGAPDFYLRRRTPLPPLRGKVDARSAAG